MLWILAPAADGHYRLRNKGSDLFAGVGGGSLDNGALVIQWRNVGQDDLLWRLDPGPAQLEHAAAAEAAVSRLSEFSQRIRLDLDNWGFEIGLKDWEKTGTAFDSQPTWGDNVPALRILNESTRDTMPVGGDYWHSTTYPVGHKGAYWIGTYEKRRRQNDPPPHVQGDRPTGTLVSKSFVSGSNYISFLIGGGNDAANLRVELLEKVPSGGTDRFTDGTYRVVPGTAKTGMNVELMRREWWDVRPHRDKTLRIRIVDSASGSWGHINVDDFRFLETDPARTYISLGPAHVRSVALHAFRRGDFSALGHVDWDAAIWGVADMHTHPASHLGFGRKLMAGDPDGDMASGLADCTCTHGPKNFPDGCGNYVRMVVVGMVDEHYAHQGDADHDHRGYPAFDTWPHFTSITHQQMHVDWIRRAYQGGLRVMVGLAVNNHLLAEAVEGDEPRDDQASADAQIEWMRDFVNRHPFMRIAYNPAELRAIVRDENKLAVVLGIEVDNLGNFNFSTVNADPDAVRAEITRLHALGVRYVFPIHVTDNAFGGAAVYNDLFNLANRFAAVQPLPPELGAGVPGTGFAVEHAPDPLVTYQLRPHLETGLIVGLRGALEAIERLPTPMIDPCFPCGDPFAIVRAKFDLNNCGSDCWTAWLDVGDLLSRQREYRVVRSYFLTPDPLAETYGSTEPGHRNTKGLTPLGSVALAEMMRLGMMIDIDHMSEKSVADALEVAGEVPGGYPLNSGHNDFRAMGGNTENQRSDAQLERIAELGGMVGVGWGYTPSQQSSPSFEEVMNGRGGARFVTGAVANTCAGTSRHFAQSYLYAVEKLGSAALGTDINGLVSPPGPRFGELARYRGNYCLEPQRDPVHYEGGRESVVPVNRQLTRCRSGEKTWDINTEGVAHYGLLPDFLQDLDNVGMQPAEMSVLFRSAEDFARMWEKSLRASTSIAR
jgi:microsomal dipeptidase-like Zn-dependent dipeptidase